MPQAAFQLATYQRTMVIAIAQSFFNPLNHLEY